MSNSFKVGNLVCVTKVDSNHDFGYDVGDIARIIEVRPVGTVVEPPLPFFPVVITEQESYEVEWVSRKRDLSLDDVCTVMYPGEIEPVL